jgi:hypothetical protein
VKRGSRKQIDPAQHAKYRRVAGSLLQSARDLSGLSDSAYGNAIAIITVHASIAYSDALSIRFGGFKSSDGDHTRAVDALQDALGTRAEASMLKKLQRVLGRKDQVSYQGFYFSVLDAQQMLEDLEIFATWAEDLLR